MPPGCDPSRRSGYPLDTDSTGPGAVAPHGRNLRELEHLVDLGMRPADAIVRGRHPQTSPLLGKPENVVAVVQAGVVRQNTMRTS